MPEKPIWYEPHPCAPERAQQIRDAGYTVIDSIYMPAGHKQPTQLPKATPAEPEVVNAESPEQPEAAPKRRGRPPKAEK